MTPANWLSVFVVLILALCTILFVASNRPLTLNPARRRQPSAKPLAVSQNALELRSVGLLPLAGCTRDDKACLRCVEVDRCLAHRLTELGLTPGVELRVIHNTSGPMVLAVRGSRVALGRDLAEKMWVEMCPPASVVETIFCPATVTISTP
jgi:ferrous iron transport protein A